MRISRFNNRLNILTSNDLENTDTSPRTLSPDTGEHYINAYNGKLKSDGNSIPATLDLDDIFASDEPSRLDDFKISISPKKSRDKDTVEDSSGDNEQKDKSNKQENESDGAKEVESDGVHEKTLSYGYVYIIIIFEAVSIVLFFIAFKC